MLALKALDRILGLPTIARWGEKLFPAESISNENNILLSTIRIPKNLLYLTDRLPKPRYVSVDEAGEGMRERTQKLNITDGNSYDMKEKLPAIPPPKPSKNRVIPRKEQYVPRHNPIVRQYKIPRIKPIVMIEESPKISPPVLPTELEIKEKNQTILEVKNEPSPVYKKSRKLPLANDGRHAVSIIEGNKRNYIENLIKNNKQQERLPDPYLNQLLSRKSPLAKQVTNNAKELADIYSGGSSVKNIIALHRRKIDRILELNRQEKEKNRISRLLPKINSVNCQQEEMNLRMELPPPFKVKGLMPKEAKRAMQKLPHYNQELVSEVKRAPSYSPIRLARGPDLYE